MSLAEGSASHPSSAPDRLFSLDFIRVVSILIILLYHFNAQLQAQWPEARVVLGMLFFHQPIGDLGVSLFIILSGVGLMLNTQSDFSASVFYKKRILAIFPSYWVAYLTVGTALFVFKGWWIPDGDGPKLILTITGLDGFLLYRGPNCYLVGEWFVGFILCLYFLFPLLRRGVLDRPILTWLAVLAIMVGLHRSYDRLFSVLENRNPLIRLPGFIFGLCFIKYVRPYDRYGFGLSIAALALFSCWYPPIHPQFYGLLLGIGVFCILVFLAQHVTVPRAVQNGTSTLARLSFLAFLVHHQIIGVLLPRFDVSRLTRVEADLLLALTVALSFGVAALLEQPVAWVSTALRALLFARVEPRWDGAAQGLLSVGSLFIGLIVVREGFPTASVPTSAQPRRGESSAYCAIDSLNSSPLSPGLRVSVESPTILSGWALMERESRLPDTVLISLQGENRTYEVMARSGLMRPDVVTALGLPARLTRSGFDLETDLSHLADGRYEMSVVSVAGSSTQVCGHYPIVVARPAVMETPR